MLLAHARHYRADLPYEFNTLTNSLLEISRRWNGKNHVPKAEPENLASKFSARLLQARDQGPAAAVEQPSLDLRAAVYSEKDSPDAGTLSQAQPHLPISSQDISGASICQHKSPSMPNHYFGAADQTSARNMTDIRQRAIKPGQISLAFPPLPPSFQPDDSPGTNTMGTTQRMDPLGYSPVELSGFRTGSTLSQALGSPAITTESSMFEGFEDLNSFLDGDFLPTQMISAFSSTGNWMNGNHNQSEGL
jgi:hypothetical protein